MIIIAKNILAVPKQSPTAKNGASTSLLSTSPPPLSTYQTTTERLVVIYYVVLLKEAFQSNIFTSNFSLQYFR